MHSRHVLSRSSDRTTRLVFKASANAVDPACPILLPAWANADSAQSKVVLLLDASPQHLRLFAIYCMCLPTTCYHTISLNCETEQPTPHVMHHLSELSYMQSGHVLFRYSDHRTWFIFKASTDAVDPASPIIFSA